jgi:preprotein translocase subunit SecA
MIWSLAVRLFGSRNDRYVNGIRPLVAKINELAPRYAAMKDAELSDQTRIFKERLAKGEKLDSLLPEAFAVVREASHRVLGERHYDVQLLGGITLHQGNIAEMKTGEGKTLTATLPVYLNALAGKGVHVVTVNDYLAKRDAAWMGRVYNFLGLSCAALYHELSDEQRRVAYASDILYATNNELGFDYLRDNMKFNAQEMVQRDLHFAIVDEVDSILIDEARTPLIISGPTQDKTELYMAVDKIIPMLKAEADYQLDEKMRSVTLTEEGTERAENLVRQAGLIGEESLYDVKNVSIVHHLNQALKAHTLFTRDKEYIVHNGEIMLIDEFTGRMTPGRRLSEGLHQAIEAKEEVKIQNENQTLASITYQNYFRLYTKLSGMTGTAMTEAEEFEQIYGLRVYALPTHVPVARKDTNDIVYRTVAEKNKAIIADVKDCVQRGQPVLVGTTSIEKSEQLSKLLEKEGVKHAVLNARHHEQEAAIVAEAGKFGAITIATNMAGRGTDIKLGGNLERMLAEAGEGQEEAVRKAYGEAKAKVMGVGGLRVISTERHESRRIDNQLRGRSGRQGDVGSSTFYISLQDDLMRIFARGLDVLMERLKMPEGEAIESRMVSNAIETAQRKIEARHFDVRKNLLKYDDVLNEQRKVIYEQRREIMKQEEVGDIVADFRLDAIEEAVQRALPPGSLPEQWNAHGLQEEVYRLFAIEIDAEGWFKQDGVTEETLVERLNKLAADAFAAKEGRLGQDLLRRIEKMVLLQVIDAQWRNHLQRLDYLREGIHLRGYAQKNPLNEYKQEAFVMFAEMLSNIKQEVCSLLSRVEVREEPELQSTDEVVVKDNRKAKPAKAEPAVEQPINRNDPCPCGSGKKYKHCHGKVESQLA